MFTVITGEINCNPEKAYIAVAASPTSDNKLNGYVLIATNEGWRFVRERGQAFGCPQPSAEEAIEMVRSLGAMVFETNSLFDVLSDGIKRMV